MRSVDCYFVTIRNELLWLNAWADPLATHDLNAKTSSSTQISALLSIYT